MTEYQSHLKGAIGLLPFQADLQGRQLEMVNRKISGKGQITDEEALKLLDDNEEELYKYLYYTSAKYIQRLDEPKYDELRKILFESEGEEQLKAFSKYLSKTENVRRLQRVFPVMITTCISAHRLGAPEALFDMVIMDEASQ